MLGNSPELNYIKCPSLDVLPFAATVLLPFLVGFFVKDIPP